MLNLIQKKQRGEELNADGIARFVSGYAAGEVPDYQAAALLMAIYFRGLSHAETVALTRSLIASGESLTYPAGFSRRDHGSFAPILDKHSTGGVGDKTSLLLVPMLAACGFKVPKMSGRGLGHTGGTIDKLESIAGFRSQLSGDELLMQLAHVGCAIVSQSPELVPAEKKLYALRDATGTVASEGLIAASILSKKIAAGASHIIIDVKCGSGAFFKRESEARDFAQFMVELAREFPPKLMAVITGMEQPLGRAVGNALEVQEVIDILEGGETEAEVARLCIVQGGLLLHFAGVAKTAREGEAMLASTLTDGSARAKFYEMVDAQGGRLDDFKRLIDGIEQRVRRVEVHSPIGGYIRRLDALSIGRFCHRLGAGRGRVDESINPWVGIVLKKKVGDIVAPQESVALAYVPKACDAEAVNGEVLTAYEIGDRSEAPDLVSGFVQ